MVKLFLIMLKLYFSSAETLPFKSVRTCLSVVKLYSLVGTLRCFCWFMLISGQAMVILSGNSGVLWSMLISGQAVLILGGNSGVFMLECVDQQSVSVVPR